MKQKLRIVAEKLQKPCSNIGLLQGKMGIAVFFFHYSRYLDYRDWEEYANQLMNEIVEEIQKMVNCDYIENLAGIGIGIEYLVQQGFICCDTNEILEDFDNQIHHIVSCFSGQINMKNWITGFGKYYVARLNNPDNRMKTSPGIELIKKHILQIVDSLPYYSFENIFSVIHFLPDVINLGIDRIKAGHYLNYAVDRLETVVYEDVFFRNYPGSFNPLIAAVLLLRAAKKNNNDDFAARALHFLDKYELNFRQYLSCKHAITWSFLYHILWKACNRTIYQSLSTQWLEKVVIDDMDFDFGELINAGMMFLTMNESINEDWLDWFPLY